MLPLDATATTMTMAGAFGDATEHHVGHMMHQDGIVADKGNVAFETTLSFQYLHRANI